MDLASLKSIKKCADRLNRDLDRIDILLNNAGVMARPPSKTEDGFEMQIGTNHFGHFYLTNLLLPLVKKVGQYKYMLGSQYNTHAKAQGLLQKPFNQLLLSS